MVKPKRRQTLGKEAGKTAKPPEIHGVIAGDNMRCCRHLAARSSNARFATVLLMKSRGRSAGMDVPTESDATDVS